MNKPGKLTQLCCSVSVSPVYDEVFLFSRLNKEPQPQPHIVIVSVMTTLRNVVGYQRLGGPCCLQLRGEYDSKVLRNVGILSHQHKVS